MYGRKGLKKELTDSFRWTAESCPELNADEGGRADDVAEDDNDRQLDRLDLGPGDPLDGARARRKRGSAFATLMAAREPGRQLNPNGSSTVRF